MRNKFLSLLFAVFMVLGTWTGGPATAAPSASQHASVTTVRNMSGPPRHCGHGDHCDRCGHGDHGHGDHCGHGDHNGGHGMRP